jgi:hypothetical protein
MNVEKIESLLLKMINKKFPFVKKVKFDVGKYNNILFILYVDADMIIRVYNVRPDLEYIGRLRGGPYTYLDEMFFIDDHDPFGDICDSLEELAEALIPPFAEEYANKVGFPDNDRMTIMYDLIKHN